MRAITTFLVALLTTTTIAQSAAQNASAAALAAQIPACARTCDDAGITKVGCSLTDYSCHCARGAELAKIIPPCLKNSTCTPADLQTFGAIPAKICAALNGTASSNSTTGSASGTSTVLSSATATPSGPSTTGSSSTSTSSSSAAVGNVVSIFLAGAGAGIFAIFF